MATLHPFRAAAESRRAAHRIRLSTKSVYACRFCWESVQVTSARYLPETCTACGASTWEEDGRCGAWIDCDAHRREGQGTANAHCHACGYSVWMPVRVPITRS
jgi:DNA-directed RNA polymerase subunit RPC12/RpoP